MFDGIKDSLRKLISSGYASEQLITEIIKDIQKAMISSDVDVKLVLDFTKKIKEDIKASKGKGLTERERVVSTIYDNLVELLGEGEKIEITKKPFILLMVGLFGAGKTTTTAKLAKFYTKRGYKVGILALDTFRPAAINQLEQLGEKISVPVMAIHDEPDPKKVIKKYKEDIKKYDIIIADSAGRDALLDDELRTEIDEINKELNPDDKLLVVSADLGQNAKSQAEEFHNLVGITGVIITKTDGTAKAGGALTSCSVTNAKVKFIGTGEGIDDLEEFDSKRYVSRLLGMGDLETLLEKAQELNIEGAEEMGKRMLHGEFTLVDLYKQLEAMGKMGPLGNILKLIPGAANAKIPKEMLDSQQENLKKYKFIMDSMTKEELEDPTVISSARAIRIAEGSGTESSDVRQLVAQYRKMKKMMKGMSGNRKMKKMMKQLGGMDPTKLDPSMFGM